MQVLRKGVFRDVSCGGGRCSPGKWAPGDRCYPDNVNVGLRQNILRGLAELKQGNPKALTDKLGCIMAGKASASIFDEGWIDSLREGLKRAMVARGFDSGPAPGDPKQDMELRLLASYMRCCEDPGWIPLVKYLAVGVRLGIGVRLPRLPAIFPPKTKWKLEGQADPNAYKQDWSLGAWRDNHTLAKERPDWILNKMREEEKLGRMVIMTEEEAIAKYGDTLIVAAQNLVSKAKTLMETWTSEGYMTVPTRCPATRA